MSHSLRCTECEIELRFPDLSFVYRLDTWVGVLTTPIWCAACNRPSYAERVPSLREFESAAAVRRLNDRSRLGHVDDELLKISDADFAALAEGLRDQRRVGACLLCQGRSYVPITFEGLYAVNLRHEVCGSRFLQGWHLGSFIGHREIRWYNLAGELVEIEHGIG